MRIFMALASSPNPTFASNLWKANLHDPLVDMGHDVVLWDGGIQPLFDLDPLAPSTRPIRAEFSERFVAAVERAHREGPLSLVFTYVTDAHLEPSAIEHVKGTVAPIVNFYCNNTQLFHLVQRTSPSYTACLVPEADSMPSYRAVGAEAIFFPMAANPAVHRPLDLPVRYDATFAGQRYGDRASLLLSLREAGIDAHAFGQSWPESDGTGGSGHATEALRGPWAQMVEFAGLALRGRDPIRMVRDRSDRTRLRERYGSALHGPVSDEDYVALFSQSRVSLGFLIVGDTHRTRHPLRQVRLREFEATMSGAFYLTGWLDELALHYEIGREIVCYRSTEELVELTRWYLAHEAERETIRHAGRARALRDHTWTRRFEDLFAELKNRGVLR